MERERLNEALGVLGDVDGFGPLEALASVEKARILLELGRPDEAQAQIDEVMKKIPDFDTKELLETRTGILLARKRFDEAEAVLDGLPDSPGIHRLRLDLALARWEEARAGEDSEAQRAAETAAFSELRGLQKQGGDEAVEALLRLSDRLTKPSPDLPAEDFDLLAQGRLRWGRPEEASRLEVRASESARDRGDDREAADYRLRAAGILLRADHRVQARHLFDQVVEDESAGEARAKAALLSALSLRKDRGQAPRPDDEKAYASALGRVAERFPRTREAGEALWLLGLARQRADDVSGALALWERIEEAHPRWLEAQLATVSLQTDETALSLAEGDGRSAEQKRRKVRQALDRVEAKVSTDAGRADLALARARLETLPTLGDPKRAVDQIDRLLTQPLNSARRGRAERLRVLALLELGRSVEAMRETRSLLETSSPADLLELARKLDRAAVSAPSDLLSRRFGEVLRLVASQLVGHPGGLSPRQRAEARLRLLRGQVFHGDSGAAREGLKGWPEALDELAPENHAELADLAIDAGDPKRALSINRAMARRHPSGSKPWFQARLGEAEALLELGETEKARRLLEATRTLHPEFGGERLRREYERLRERLEREQSFRSGR